MANIVIVSALYPPEPVVSSKISFELANFLARKGHAVTVLRPAPTRPLGIDFGTNGNHELPPKKHVDQRVNVITLPSYTHPQSSLWGRIKESYSFGKLSSQYITEDLPETDVVYANTWPMFGQYLLATALKKKKIPLVLHIQDIYPESFLEKLPGGLKKIVGLPLIALDREIVTLASSIVVVSQNMREFYQQVRSVPVKKLSLVQNFEDETPFLKVMDREDRLDKSFTFMYLGNIGPVAGVELLIESFKLANIPDSNLVIAGNGAAKENCQRLAADFPSITFISVPTTEMTPAQALSNANVLLLPVRKNAAMSSIPSKLISYLFSAKPVLAALDLESDTSRAILDSGCGWVGPPEDATWLAEQMKVVSKLPVRELETMGQQGFAYGIENFSKKEGLEKLNRIIMDTLHENRR